jgi:hypothetical protein
MAAVGRLEPTDRRHPNARSQRSAAMTGAFRKTAGCGGSAQPSPPRNRRRAIIPRAPPYGKDRPLNQIPDIAKSPLPTPNIGQNPNCASRNAFRQLPRSPIGRRRDAAPTALEPKRRGGAAAPKKEARGVRARGGIQSIS